MKIRNMSRNQADLGPPPELLKALLNDPAKRALLLQFFEQEKEGFAEYKRQEEKTKKATLAKRFHCESPSSIQRRRLLEHRDQDLTSEGSSDLSTEVKGPQLPFEELLKGVKAYVEVKRGNVDKSPGIKSIMKLMGATISDTFTNDVTHVVFKEGSFTTFEKAKLMRIHLVSVLWLDAIRRHKARVPEKNYPAFGNKVADANVSILCSQLQKDFEDIITEEKRRSLSILPSQRQSKMYDGNMSRRRTMMTSQSSMSSYVTAQNQRFFDSDNEVARITSQQKPDSPELTSDDSDCGVIDGYSSGKRSKNNLDILQAKSNDNLSNCSDSSGSISLLSRVPVKNRKTHITAESSFEKSALKNSIQSSTMSSLRISLETDKTKSGLGDSSSKNKSKSSLRISSETDKTKSGLGDSSTKNKSRNSLISNKENTRNSTMSSLRISASSCSNIEKEKNKRKTVSSERISLSDSEKPNRQQESKKLSRRRSKKDIFSESEIEESSDSDRENQGRNKRKTLNNSDSEKRKKTPKKVSKPETSVQKRRNKKCFDSESSNSEVENQEKPSKSIHSGSESDDESSTKGNNFKSRRIHSASTLNCSVILTKTTDENTNTSENQNAKRRKTVSIVATRSSSVNNLVTNSSEISKRNGRSASVASESKKTESNSSFELNSSEKTKRNRRSASVASESKKKELNPSPTKKTRIEQPSATKRTRKLYNPDDVVLLPPPEEDKEREAYIKQKSQKSPDDLTKQKTQKNSDDLFVNPNNVKTRIPLRSKNRSLTPSDFSDDESLIKSPEKKKKTKKIQTPPRRNSSEDEQRSLLDLLNSNNQIRRSGRLVLSEHKPKYRFTSSSSESQTSSLPITPIKRRSTLDFVQMSQLTQKRRLKLDTKRTSIVCTKMHRPETLNFEKAVKALGRFFVEDVVTSRTTHLVAGEAKRTVNMLKALARGCWILNHDWLLKSQEQGKWLSEEDYELTEYSPAVQQCRLQREAFGSSYSMDIFKDCGVIYVAQSTAPKPADLKELISICQGRVAASIFRADIVVGEYINRDNLTCVSETWILDCIHWNKFMPLKHYLIKSDSQQSPTF